MYKWNAKKPNLARTDGIMIITRWIRNEEWRKWIRSEEGVNKKWVGSKEWIDSE